MKTLIVFNSDIWPEISLADISEVITDFDNHGTLIFNGRNKLRRVDICGIDVAVKRFKKFNLIRKITRRFRKSKARRAYFNALKLCQLGFETPTPIAFVEQRNWWGALVDSYYLCQYRNITPIDAVLDNPKALELFAEYAVKLHNAGVLHHDLNRTNVCFDPKNPDNLMLIDINRMSFRKASLRDRRNNLQRFCKSGDVFNTFTKLYLHKAGLPSDLLPQWIVAKQRWDDRRARKKVFKKFLKKILP